MTTLWHRRLALVVAPAYGESFASWVDRMALRNGCPPWTLGEDFLTIYDGEYVFENLRDATGLRARAMMRMALMGQGGQFITHGWTGNTRTRPWPWRADTAAVCPRCLAGPDSIWRIAWHLLPCVVCPQHRVYLTGWCPSCHTRISVGDTPATGVNATDRSARGGASSAPATAGSNSPISPTSLSQTSGCCASSTTSSSGNQARPTTCTHPRLSTTWTCPRLRCSWPAKAFDPGKPPQVSGHP
ncbi:TniQ family protein [Nonomuraea angiospora]|uniref:TniQ family protein n=1 Tax=Nonomuraea angiospora TaxID=46172 RepID=UPI00343A6E86